MDHYISVVGIIHFWHTTYKLYKLGSLEIWGESIYIPDTSGAAYGLNLCDPCVGPGIEEFQCTPGM